MNTFYWENAQIEMESVLLWEKFSDIVGKSFLTMSENFSHNNTHSTSHWEHFLNKKMCFWWLVNLSRRLGKLFLDTCCFLVGFPTNSPHSWHLVLATGLYSCFNFIHYPHAMLFHQWWTHNITMTSFLMYHVMLVSRMSALPDQCTVNGL